MVREICYDITTMHFPATCVSKYVIDYRSRVTLDSCKSLQPPSSKKSEHVLADRDFKSLQYIAGYIVHKMYTKLKFSNKYKSDHSQQTLSMLNSCKVEHDDSQT